MNNPSVSSDVINQIYPEKVANICQYARYIGDIFPLSSSSDVVHEIPLVVPQSTDVSSASIAFCSVDCDVFSSSIESSTGLLRDGREVYALDHSPTL